MSEASNVHAAYSQSESMFSPRWWYDRLRVSTAGVSSSVCLIELRHDRKGRPRHLTDKQLLIAEH